MGCKRWAEHQDCVTCWLIKRISRSLSGRDDVPNPDVPNTLVNHMSERISGRFLRGRQV